MTENADIPPAGSVTSLRGDEGGRWRVVTQGSAYVFDLDVGTVTRYPGPGSSSTVNDMQRRIREIVRCSVGEGGYWTMRSDGGPMDLVDFYWQACTVIQRIEPIANDD